MSNTGENVMKKTGWKSMIEPPYIDGWYLISCGEPTAKAGYYRLSTGRWCDREGIVYPNVVRWRYFPRDKRDPEQQSQSIPPRKRATPCGYRG